MPIFKRTSENEKGSENLPLREDSTSQSKNMSPSQGGDTSQTEVRNPDEQMLRRQSGPKPTAEDEARKLFSQRGNAQQGGAVSGFEVLAEKIGKEEVQKAWQTLLRYKEGKANLEKKVVDNEQWYKLRHWECMRDKKQDVQPVSAWLFNCIASKHADAMDNFPSPNVLPREEGDKAEAEMLTSIIPVILDQCDFEQTYSDVVTYKLKTGTGVYGVFWDSSKMNGLGDVSIRKIDLLNLFWESGITDIQRSRNLFHVELMDDFQHKGNICVLSKI